MKVVGAVGVFGVVVVGAAVVEGASGTAEEVGWAAVHGFLEGRRRSRDQL